MYITIYRITELNFLTEFHKLTFYRLENDVWNKIEFFLKIMEAWGIHRYNTITF